MEMLVRLVDKEKSGDVYIDRHRSERGCVICIMPDGHVWSKREQTNPEWKIIKFPGIEQSHVSHFITPQLGYCNPDVELEYKTLRRWQYKFDVDAFEILNSLPTFNNKFKTNPTESLSILLNTLKIKLSDLKDPLIFGNVLIKNKVFG